MLSPALMHRCADGGISLVLLNNQGRFKARLEGQVSGNILLRDAREAADAEDSSARASARARIEPGKLSSSHGLTGTRASSPQADRMSALPVSILELAQKVNRINSDKVKHHVGFN